MRGSCGRAGWALIAVGFLLVTASIGRATLAAGESGDSPGTSITDHAGASASSAEERSDSAESEAELAAPAEQAAASGSGGGPSSGGSSSGGPSGGGDAPSARVEAVNGDSDEVEGQPKSRSPAGSIGPAAQRRRSATGRKRDSRGSGRRAATAEAGQAVTIIDFAYSPASITVAPGDTVSWTNRDKAPHTATARGEFDTGILEKGESGSVTLDDDGTFDYICTVHPEMKGTVTVASAGGGSSSAGGPAGSGAATVGSSVSEAEATAAPDAAGSDDRLPATGAFALPPALTGVALIALGLALRRRAAA